MTAQVIAAIPGVNATPPQSVRLTKPATDQAVTIQLDGAAQIDLSSIADTPVTFVHVDILQAAIAGKQIANGNVRGFVRKWRARRDSNS